MESLRPRIRKRFVRVVVSGFAGSSGMMVLLEKQVHLQNEAGEDANVKVVSDKKATERRTIRDTMSRQRNMTEKMVRGGRVLSLLLTNECVISRGDIKLSPHTGSL